MKRILLLPVLLFFFIHLSGQVIYLSTINNRIYRLNIVTCNYTQITALNRGITDISFHPDKTLYGIDTNGSLFEIDTMNGSTANIYTFNGTGQRFNSLTTSADGIIYATGNEGKLFTYTKTNNTGTYLGRINYNATGDLTFYKGNLYVAADNDRIVLVNIANPANSSIAIDEDINGRIFGIVSYASSCDNINCYAISNGNSTIYEIDFDNKTLQPVCDLNIQVGGGASTYEFLGSNPVIIDSVKTINPTCQNNDGALSINATGGIGALMYSINGTNFQSSSSFSNLPSGSYQFIVKDGIGCEIIEDFTLTIPAGPVIDNLSMTTSTCGSANGTILVNASGGTNPLNYSIDGLIFQNSPVFNGLVPDQYFITVTDASGCSTIDSIDVLASASDTIKSISASLVSCDVSTGSLQVLMQNGTGIKYSLDGINFQAGNLFKQLNPGHYLVTIKDINGCKDTMSASIYPPLAVNIDQVIITDPICAADQGAVEVLVSGGTGQILYSLDGIAFQDTTRFNHLTNLQYQIIVKDENGCADTAKAILKPGLSPVIDRIRTDSSHCQLDDGSLTISANGGTGLLSYSIDGINFQPENYFDSLGPLNFKALVKDVNGCTDSTLADVYQINALRTGTIDLVSPRCDIADGTIEVETTGGIGEVLYSIDGIKYQLSNQFQDLNPGHFTIEIKDEAGCTARAITDLLPSSPIIINRIDAQPTLCEFPTGTIDMKISGGTGQYAIVFDGNHVQTQTTFRDLQAGDHEILITDANGCTADSIVSVARERCQIYIPNSFSPNQDGVNDVFELSSSDEQNIVIRKYMIFDRWGNMVYKTGEFPISSTDFWWDGTFKKISVTPGVFAYYIEVKYEDGSNDVFKGDVTLIR